MEPTAEQSAGIKKVQLDMLEAFVKICEENHLQYWLVGGTALGAVRHNGFIPWDDDIDVALPRPDYDRFMEIGQSLLPDYYFLQNYKTEPNYPICFAKIRDCRTTYIETSSAHLDINHGIWIDVFSMDGVADNKITRRINHFVDMIAKVRIGKCFKTEKAKLSVKTVAVTILAYLIYPKASKAVIARVGRFKKTPCSDSKRICNYNGAWGEKKESASIETMGKGADVKFEHLTVKVPSDADAYLSNMYGDYMTPPPPEKRVGHHYADVIDIEKPYTDYR